VIAGFVALVALRSSLTPTPRALPGSDSTLLIQNAAPVSDLAFEQAQNGVTPIWSFGSGKAASSSGISPIFTKEIQHWGKDIIRWANAASLEPNLVATIMQIESCGDPRATSRSGAMGLFQVMPFHFHFGENPYDPETNALRGLNYLSRSLSSASGDARSALAGYNGGVGVIARPEWLWPSETKRYVYYGGPIYQDARNGATSSAMLAEWYQKYGAGLCRQAAQRLGIP
jgi:soluble lytic murein transglycosylase-like protein